MIRARRSLIAFVIVSSSLATGGCFALFELDSYGPSSNVPEAGLSPPQDGNVDGPSSSSDASSIPDVANGKVVFVTSETFSGALPNADDNCQRLANAAGLSGTFKAWRSDANTNPKASFAALANANENVPLINPMGSLIAASYAELADAGPRIAISVSEKRENVGTPAGDVPTNQMCPTDDDRYVWTSTNPDGTRTINQSNVIDCSAWTVETANTYGAAGQIGAKAILWTLTCGQTCSAKARLYCFQQ